MKLIRSSRVDTTSWEICGAILIEIIMLSVHHAAMDVIILIYFPIPPPKKKKPKNSSPFLHPPRFPRPPPFPRSTYLPPYTVTAIGPIKPPCKSIPCVSSPANRPHSAIVLHPPYPMSCQTATSDFEYATETSDSSTSPTS